MVMSAILQNVLVPKKMNMKDLEEVNYMKNKDKKKFDIALINSRVVYWYMQNLDGSFDKYLDRINDYLEWMSERPSEKVAYNAMKVVKEFICKYNLSDEFLRNYCYTLEHNNPREDWRKIMR
jgi:hypothetical protein